MANGRPYLNADGKIAYAPAAGPWASGLQAYTYAPDDHGGVNFFLNGKPITKQQYAAGTGSDTGSILSGASQNFNKQADPGPTNNGPSSQDKYYADAAAAKAQDDAQRAGLKSRGTSLIDQLMQAYGTIKDKIKATGADTVNRLNGEYDGKVKDQIDDTNRGLYTVDQVSAANNLGDSSYRSFDKGAVQTVGDKNVKTVNDQRSSDLSTIGTQVNTDLAKYGAASDSLVDTRALLDGSDSTSDVSNTVNTLSSTLAGTKGDSAKYDTQGSFVASANKLGNYDTSKLTQALDAVVGNSSATKATKAASVNQLIDGTGADDATKAALKNKYIQTLG